MRAPMTPALLRDPATVEGITLPAGTRVLAHQGRPVFTFNGVPVRVAPGALLPLGAPVAASEGEGATARDEEYQAAVGDGGTP